MTPLLSLSMICGPGRADELERCLKSCQGGLFDEIVLAVNGGDRKVLEVAHRLANKVYHFEWNDDFAAARNYCLDQCTGNFVFWLDSDDVIKPKDYEKLLEVKKELAEGKHEVVYLMYNYGHDSYDNPTSPLPRERIFPNDGRFRWYYPCHEIVLPEGRVSRLERQIAIDHYQNGTGNNARNLRILEKAFNSPNCDPRVRFYYVRDLCETDLQKGMPLAIEAIEKNLIPYNDERAALCRILANEYYHKQNWDLCERYCYKGLQASVKFAELYAFLGCMAYDRKEEARAEKFFEAALACGYEINLGPWTGYYKLIPAQNLFMINFITKKDYAKALMYNKMVLEVDPNNAQALADRELVWNHFFNNFELGPKETLPGLPEPMVKISVAWLIPHLNLDDPATRIRRVNISQTLTKMGYDSFVVHDYQTQPLPETLKQIRDASVCVFTQYSDYDLALMKQVKDKGRKVVVDTCEAIFGYPGQAEAFGMADKVVACSTKLAEWTREKTGAGTVVVRDAVENMA